MLKEGIDLIAAGFAVLFASLAVFRVWPGLRRNEIGLHPDRPASWWVLGLALWRGQVRLLPLGVLLTLVVPPLILATGLEISWLYWPSGAMIAVVLILALTVLLFNRPKRVVVPHLRHQPGLIHEWRGADVGPTPRPQTLLGAHASERH